MEFPEPNLTLYQAGDSFLKVTIQQDSALFAEGTPGSARAGPTPANHVGWWGEFGARSRLEGKLVLGDYGSGACAHQRCLDHDADRARRRRLQFRRPIPKETTLEDALRRLELG
jgi:hypothetical protein